MKDRLFFPLALLVAVTMVGGALMIGSGQPACGPMGGANGAADYSIITIKAGDLCRMEAGGESDLTLIKGSSGDETLRIEMAAEALRDKAEDSPHFKLGPDLETVYAGQTLRISMIAKPADKGGAMAFEVKYSTGKAGDSGWHRFDLEPGWKTYSFEFNVPQKLLKQTVAIDYFAIRPVTPEKARAVLVRQIDFERLGAWGDQ